MITRQKTLALLAFPVASLLLAPGCMLPLTSGAETPADVARAVSDPGSRAAALGAWLAEYGTAAAQAIGSFLQGGRLDRAIQLLCAQLGTCPPAGGQPVPFPPLPSVPRNRIPPR